ncbi:7-methylguanosine phosphate-specific 5'-nucleotidase A isoform X2 [Ananas comosus]|uniref:5'-nucleotidase n=1 Tax=Ananas comosus TaxID=4615 RepID=A0A6P5EVG9_ANACO|nr:7-methylguanosine phosphate-specific 5'-nucleotidase A isoform X2 [Ananas comosus]
MNQYHVKLRCIRRGASSTTLALLGLLRSRHRAPNSPAKTLPRRTALPLPVPASAPPSRAFPLRLSPPLSSPPSRVSIRRRLLRLRPRSAPHSPPIMSSSEVVIPNPESLEKKKGSMRNGGRSKLQVIADFDGTLTRYWYNGSRGQSSHGLLQQGNPEYDAKREALFEYYHPLEISPTIPIEEKTKLMEEWWEKTHGLLIEGGLTYDAIKKSVTEATISFRDGVVELFEFLEERDIPVLVFSAGLADIIEEVFRQKLHRSFKNIKVVSNRMVFDENGRLVAFKGKTIHVLNKNEHALDMAAPVHDKFGDLNGSNDDTTLVKKRTNVILLGDHIGDLGMSDGVNFENRIAVGFLNSNVEKSLKDYCNTFDVVYLNDASMWGVVELVSELCPLDD